MGAGVSMWRRRNQKGSDMGKVGAIWTMLANCEEWLGGAVVVADGEGYEAIPAAYLSDVSYTGSCEVLYKATSLGDVTGDARGWLELGEDEQAWAVAQVMAGGEGAHYAAAMARIDAAPELEPYREIILYDWPEGAEHWAWVAAAPVAEIVAWCEGIREDERLQALEDKLTEDLD
jgi:hypothetical protein